MKSNFKSSISCGVSVVSGGLVKIPSLENKLVWLDNTYNNSPCYNFTEFGIELFKRLITNDDVVSACKDVVDSCTIDGGLYDGWEDACNNIVSTIESFAGVEETMMTEDLGLVYLTSRFVDYVRRLVDNTNAIDAVLVIVRSFVLYANLYLEDYDKDTTSNGQCFGVA